MPPANASSRLRRVNQRPSASASPLSPPLPSPPPVTTGILDDDEPQLERANTSRTFDRPQSAAAAVAQNQQPRRSASTAQRVISAAVTAPLRAVFRMRQAAAAAAAASSEPVGPSRQQAATATSNAPTTIRSPAPSTVAAASISAADVRPPPAAVPAASQPATVTNSSFTGRFPISPFLPEDPDVATCVRALIPAMVFSVAYGLVLFSIIASAAYLLWLLVSPYATGICAGLFLGVVLRNHFIETTRHDRELARRTDAVRLRLQHTTLRSMWVSWLATPAALFYMLHYEIDHMAGLCGFHKYAVIGRHHTFRVLALLGTVTCYFVALSGFEIIAIPGAWLLATILMLGWWVKTQTMARALRIVSVLTVGSLVSVLLAREVWSEANLLRNDAARFMEIARRNGVRVPPAVYEKGPRLLSNYFFSENATTAIIDLIDALPNRNHTSVGDQIRYAVSAAISGNMTELQEVIPAFHRAVEAGSEIAKSTSLLVFNFTLALITFLLGLLYEMTLFYFTLNFLTRQERSIVYHAAYQFSGWLSADDSNAGGIAVRVENQALKSLDKLAMSYAHIVIFHFNSTFLVFAMCRVAYPVASAVWVTFFAVLPVGVPITVPFWVAGAVQLYNRDIEQFVPFAVSAALVTLFGGNIQFFTGVEQNPSLLTTSFILGYVAFGIKGIFIGPLVVVGCSMLWKASNASSVFSRIASPASARETRRRR